MAIQYIKIIREIMGSEAEKRGYKITAGPKLLTKRCLADFYGTIDGESSGFYIEKDFILDRAMTLTCCGKRITTYDNDDEATFRQCIQQFQVFMMEEGYSLLEEAAMIPYFSDEDIEYVKLNYEAFGRQFYNGHERGLKSDVSLIEEAVNGLFNKTWDEAKDELLIISGALTLSLLTFVPSAELKEYDNGGYYYIESDAYKRRFSVPPMMLIYNAFMEKDVQRWMTDWIKEVWE